MKSPYTYKHLSPSSPASVNKQPAIFLLHGLGSNEDDLLQLVDEFKDTCHIFSMRGPITHKPGFAFYTFEEEGKPNREVFDKMIIFTQNFILEAIEEFGLDKNKIFVIGFNQGAVVAQSLAVVMGDALKGIAALSGFLPDFVRLEYKKPVLTNVEVLITHGEYDYVYPIQWGEVSKEFFIEYGANVEYITYPDGHGVTPENLRDLITFIAQYLEGPIN